MGERDILERLNEQQSVLALDAADEIRSLRAELAEARADSERLDWLDDLDHHHSVFPDALRNGERWGYFAADDTKTTWSDTLRAAIDSAREKQD